jgi:hypothetical protein
MRAQTVWVEAAAQTEVRAGDVHNRARAPVSTWNPGYDSKNRSWDRLLLSFRAPRG